MTEDSQPIDWKKPFNPHKMNIIQNNPFDKPNNKFMNEETIKPSVTSFLVPNLMLHEAK